MLICKEPKLFDANSAPKAGIILIMCRLLHYPLSKLRQPRVIAEVIGGILLGPSVMGHIPGFSNAIFPAVALPNLTLVANLGLVLFLFLVGLEVDLRFLASNWRPALSVGALGMALPFGLGCGISYGLYHQFRTDPGLKPISFGVYMLFVGVAMAITVQCAYPACFRSRGLQKTGFPCPLPHPYRAQALENSSRSDCSFRRRRQ